MRVLESGNKKVILLGNEAVVRGALEAGVEFATTFPGTPASEIGNTFYKIAKDVGIYFEYSVNEKVAIETAAGAAFSGLKSIVAFKHFGLNVASDTFMPIVYLQASPIVIAVADDPSCWSSAQSEQDSRWYAEIAKIPMIEPSDPQETKDFTKLAFEMSEKYKTPVFLRLTTRVSHTKMPVELDEIKSKSKKGRFQRDWERFNNLPPHILELKRMVLEKLEKIREEVSEKLGYLNRIEEGSDNIGIITSGVSYHYVKEACKKFGVNPSILKISMANPEPKKMIAEFIKDKDVVLVVEELDDYLERKVKLVVKEFNIQKEIHGKDSITGVGELRVEHVINALQKIYNISRFDFSLRKEKYKNIEVPKRFPTFCPGCPHRSTYYAFKVAMEELGLRREDVVIGGDIGCYMLAINPPYQLADFIIDMGAGLGVSHGIAKSVENQKVVAFIGDGTFYHAGMPQLLNARFNNSNLITVVLDNSYTAMTGQQPNPGSDVNAMGEKVGGVKIEEIAKAFGYKNVAVINPYNLKEAIEVFRKALASNEQWVIVSRAECRLAMVRRLMSKDLKIPKFYVANQVEECKEKLMKIGCPAIQMDENGNVYIDQDLCWGCGLCFQICPQAVRAKVEK